MMQVEYGLIGKKLGHSFSKKYFTEKFAREQVAASYELFELPDISAFPALLRSRPQLKGLNVTIPYKQQVLPYLQRLSPEAEAVGAVNTIVIRPGGLEGHNTDVFGFWESLRAFTGPAALRAALVLGTGGAAKAVGYVLEHKLGLQQCLYVSRRPTGPQQISYEALSSLHLPDFQLIVNTTPLGMYPHADEAPAFPYQHLTSAHYVMDLIYNPAQTRFLQLASKQGAHTENGMPMLIGQAEGAWAIWSGTSS